MRLLPAIGVLWGCTPGGALVEDPEPSVLSAARMKTDVDWLADDASEGRLPGSVGHDQARDHLIDALEAMGLQPLGEDGFVHTFAHRARTGHYLPTEDGGATPSVDTIGQNLVGVLPGADPERADEFVLLVAHYDHLGVTQDGSDVFNGAFDDAAGVALVLELVRAVIDQGEPLDRSLIVMLSDSEEAGLLGARAWVDDPTVDPADVVVALSADPVGRPLLPDYWPLVLMGAERSPTLLELLRAIPWDGGDPGEVRFLARDMIEGFASDQDAFLEEDLPGLWITSPGMTFYHQPEDTADTIDYRVLTAHGAWLLDALRAIDAHEGRFDVIEPPPWDAFVLGELVGIMEGLIASDELDGDEVERVQTLLAQVRPAAEAGDPDLLGSPDTLKLATVLLLFDLSRAHPGPIPPPFPD